MQIIRVSISTRALVGILAILVSGCLSHPRVETVLHESPHGAVSLKEFSDPSVHANHPISLDPDLLRRVLAGVHVQERKTLIESALTKDAKSMPVFTFSEVSFLAPWVKSGLAQATAGEQVWFLINSTVSGKRLDTEGTMYADGANVHLSLTELGLRSQRPGTLSQPSQSFDRAKRWTLTFTPESALVNWKAETQVSADGSEPNTLVISLERLARYPDPMTGAAPGLEETGRAPGELEDADPAHKTGEAEQSTESMEEELRRMQRTIEEQQERLERLERELGKRQSGK